MSEELIAGQRSAPKLSEPKGEVQRVAGRVSTSAQDPYALIESHTDALPRADTLEFIAPDL